MENTQTKDLWFYGECNPMQHTVHFCQSSFGAKHHCFGRVNFNFFVLIKPITASRYKISVSTASLESDGRQRSQICISSMYWWYTYTAHTWWLYLAVPYSCLNSMGIRYNHKNITGKRPRASATAFQQYFLGTYLKNYQRTTLSRTGAPVAYHSWA